MENRPKLTLDNNCIINLLDMNSATATSVEELYEIVRLSLSGAADIAITTRVEADLENDKNAERKAVFLKQIQMFPVVGTVARWGVSKWGQDKWGGEKSSRIADDLQKVIFPGGLKKESSTFQNKRNDIDHLLGHLINGRDVFVTDDKAILRKAKELEISPGIVVMSPQTCLRFLNDQIERARKTPLNSTRASVGYHSRGLRGTVTFDYSNNNGTYVIGDGLFLFEIKWSGANSTSIYAYNDAPSVDSIAIARGLKSIEEVREAAQYDFTSRSRAISEGEVLIVQNTNGIYAAIGVLDIKAISYGDERDEISFEYAIQIDGSADFSAI